MKKNLLFSLLLAASLSAYAGQTQAEPSSVSAPGAVSPQSDTDAEWGEWYDYVSGKLTFGEWDEWTYCSFMRISEPPARATFKRRDSKTTPEKSQLKLADFFGEGVDWVLDFDTEKNSLTWERFDTGRYFSDMSEAQGFKAVKVDGGSAMYYPKMPLTLDVSLLIVEDQHISYDFTVLFAPDNLPKAVNTYPSLTAESVNADKFTVAFDGADKDVATLKFALLNVFDTTEMYVDNEPRSIFDLIGNNYDGLEIVSLNADQIKGFSAEYDFKCTGPTTLFVAAYDSEGDMISTNSKTIYAQLEESGKWKDLGRGLFTEPYILPSVREVSTYGQAAGLNYWVPEWEQVESWEVDVQESTATPGLYRVVNPYGVSPLTDAECGYERDGNKVRQRFDFDRGDNNYYLIIHAENPAFIWVEPNYAGFSYRENDEIDKSDNIDSSRFCFNTVFGTSVYPYLVANPEAYGESPLIMADGVITLAGDYSNAFTLVLPKEQDGIESIGADSAAPIYFDLSGRRVINPAHGIYIEVRGGEARTIIRR